MTITVSNSSIFRPTGWKNRNIREKENISQCVAKILVNVIVHLIPPLLGSKIIKWMSVLCNHVRFHPQIGFLDCISPPIAAFTVLKTTGINFGTCDPADGTTFWNPLERRSGLTWNSWNTQRWTEKHTRGRSWKKSPTILGTVFTNPKLPHLVGINCFSQNEEIRPTYLGLSPSVGQIWGS